LPGDFASFTGPDRPEALAHYYVASLVDAAEEVERTLLQPEEPKVIPNEQADALFLLASLSADRPPQVLSQNQQDDIVIPSQDDTPSKQCDLHNQSSPSAPLTTTSTPMSLETANSTSTKIPKPQDKVAQRTPVQETNGVAVKEDPEVPKDIAPHRLS